MSAGTILSSEPTEPVERPASSSAIGISRIGKNTLIYATGEGLTRLVGFVMLPIYTRFLTPADYGVLELLSMTIEVVAMIAGIGIASSVFKFYADAEDSRSGRLVISTATTAVILLAAVTAFLGFLASPLLADLVLGSAGEPLYFRLFFLIYLVQSASAIPFLLLRLEERAVLFVGISLAKLVGMLSLNVFFVVGLEMGVLGILLSNLIVTGASGLGLLVYLYVRTGWGFSAARLRAMVAFGFPMVFWFLGSFILVFSDRYFVNHFTGTEAVGLYSLAYKFAFILSGLAFAPFQMFWDPQRFLIARQENALEIFRRVFLYLNLVIGAVGLVIVLFVEDLLRIMADPAFLPAHRLVPLVVAAQIVYLWTAYTNLGLFLKSKTQVLAMMSGVVVATVLLLNLLLIPRFGTMGAALATLVAYSVRMGGVYFFSQRAYRCEYDWGRIARLYVLFALAFLVRGSFATLPLIESVLLSAAMVLATLALAVRLVLPVEERARLRRMLRGIRPVRGPRAARA
jgi:O-antigen/teichoic acid export membrane protein